MVRQQNLSCSTVEFIPLDRNSKNSLEMNQKGFGSKLLSISQIGRKTEPKK